MSQKEISLREIEVKGVGERVQNKVKVDKGSSSNFRLAKLTC